MTSYRILRNRKADTSEVGFDEIEMNRERVSQVSQLDEGDNPSDSNRNMAADQVPPANSEQSHDETMWPQQQSQALPQDSESDQTMPGSLHTILTNILASLQASKEETASLIRSTRESIKSNKEETIKIIQDRVTEVQEETAKLLESARDQATRQSAELKDSIRKLSERMDRKLDTSIAETYKKIDSVEARLEAKATALEGRINKDKTEIKNDIELMQNDMKELRAKMDKDTQEITEGLHNRIMEVRQEYTDGRDKVARIDADLKILRNQMTQID
jgi:hypothetical protein